MKPSLRKSLFSKIATLSLASMVCISVAFVYMEYHYFKKDADRTRHDHLSAQKQLLRSEVNRAVEYVRYMKSRTESRLQASIRARVYEAHTIATHLFNRFDRTMTRQELTVLIKDTLRPIRFNNGRGYYFIADLKQKVILLPIDPKIEGSDLSDRQDQDGTYVFRTASDIVRRQKEGFFEYRWPKPGVPKRQFRKISFVKHFAPMNWYIGSGEYIDDVAADIQGEVKGRLEKIRFGDNGYIFAGQWDGRSLTGPTRGKNMLDITDANGVKIVRELITAAKQGGGFVEYVQPPFTGGRPTEKISYAVAVPQWRWYVGAGVYVDTIEDRIADQKKELDRRLCWHVFLYGLLFLGLGIGSFLAAHRLSGHMDTVVKSFLDFFEAAKGGAARIAPELQPYAEFSQLASAANEMAEGREKAETALRRSEAQFRSAFNSESVGMALIGLDKKFIRVNSRLCRTLGYPAVELIDRPVNDLTHPDDRDGGDERVSRLVSGEDRYNSAEKRFIHKSGHVVWALVSNALVTDTAGRPQLIVTYLLDITAKKQAEEELREHIWLLESMDRVNRAIQQGGDLEQMLKAVLEEVLDIFQSDRAWLLFPCDPEAPTWSIPMEVTRPCFPGAFSIGENFAMTPDIRNLMAERLAANAPLTIDYDPGQSQWDPDDKYAVRSNLSMALVPKVGKPWNFGLHQCAYKRKWTESEKRLFQEIGRRIADGLGTMLSLKNLGQSEERYREIVEGTDNLVTEVDIEGKFTFVNEASRKVFGLEPRECIGKPAFDFIHPEDRQKTMDQFTRWIEAKKKSVTFENRQVDRTGQARDMLWSINFHYDGAGNISSIKSIARDITERKQTEQRLMESERKLRDAQKLANIGYWFWNVETGEVEWSEEVFNLFGLTPETFTPQIGSILQLSPWPGDHQRDRELLQKAMKNHEPGTYEQRFLRPDGGIGYYLSTFQGIYDENRQLIAMRGTAQDITERKRAEEELSRYRDHLEDLVEERAAALRRINDNLHREISQRKRVEGALRDSERRLAEILDFLPDATLVVDRQGRVKLWNRAIEEMTGIQAADILGKGDYEYAIPFFGVRRPILVDLAMNRDATYEKKYLNIKEAGDRLVGEAYTPNLGPGGVFIWGSARPLYDAQGEVVGAIESVRDITDQKQTEEALRQYADTQTVLVREVNHRVKNNLSAIIGMLHMEQDRAEAEGMTSYIPVLRDLVGRIEGLSTVHSLLSASGWHPLDAGELCRRVADAALKGIPLGKRIDLEISPSRVRINSNQAHHLTLVINELTTNTVKYALKNRNRAGIAIDIQQRNQTLEIRFQDDGPGFPGQILRNDFVPDSIGFELIRGIVRQSLGGEVAFRNDRGAVVEIRFGNELAAGGGAS